MSRDGFETLQTPIAGGGPIQDARIPLEALFEAMTEGVVVHDRAGRIIQWNRAALESLGLSADQLAGRTPSHPDWRTVREDLTDFPAEEHPATVALRTGETCRCVMGVFAPGSRLRWLTVTAVPYFGAEDTSPHQVIVTFHDVTEEKRAQLRLRLARQEFEERERFLSATLSTLPCLVSYIDRDLRYRYVNRLYENWFGLKTRTIIGMTLEELIGPDALEVLRPQINGVLAGSEQRFETELTLFPRGTRNVEITYIPDLDRGGQVRGFYAVVQDISAQVRANRLVQAKEEEVRRILNNLPALIGYWDADCRNVHSNTAYTEYFGRPPERIRGLHISEVLGRELYEKNLPYIEAVLRGEPQTFEREIPLPDGSRRQTLAIYLPDSADGRVLGFFVIVSDITRLKELERERREMELRLISSSKLSSLGEMAAGIAHEINNPLTIIQSHASQLKFFAENGGLEAAAAIRGLGKIESTVDRIAAIVRGLRAFARDAEADPLIRSDLRQIIAETLELCRARLKSDGVDLRLRLGGTPELDCRPAQISQILMNLISNASDAVAGLSREDRWIEISVDEDEGSGRLRIRVTDGGRGIPPEVAVKMMQPFYTTKEVGKGTGLGLSVSRGLAESHRGSLNYEESGGHTSFLLELPVRSLRQD